jgi:hypothetical protein
MRWSQRPRQTSAPAARRTSRTRYSSPRRRRNAQALATWAIESTKHHTAIPVPKGAGRLRHARIAKLVKAASQHRHAKTTGPIGRCRNHLLLPSCYRYRYQRATRRPYLHNPEPLPTLSSAPGGHG